MLKNLSNFASLEVLNSEEVKGGTCYIPRPCGCGYGWGNQKSSKSSKNKCKSKKSKKSKKSNKCK